MPREVVDALKKSGHWQEGAQAAAAEPTNDRRARPFRARARAVPVAGAGEPAAGRRVAAPSRHDGGGARRGARELHPRRPGLRRADQCLCHLGFLGAERRREQPYRQAAALQDHRRVGEPRRLDDPLGLHPHFVRGGGGVVRRQPAARAARARPRCPGHDRQRLPAVHPVHLQPVPARAAGAGERATGSTRCCRIPASPSIRPSFISAMSASRSPSRSRSRRSSRGGSMPPGRAGSGRGPWPPGAR